LPLPGLRFFVRFADDVQGVYDTGELRDQLASDERKFRRLKGKIKARKRNVAAGRVIPLEETAAYQRFKAAMLQDKLAIIDEGLAEIKAGVPGIPNDVVMKTLDQQIRNRFGKRSGGSGGKGKAKGKLARTTQVRRGKARSKADA
jgi:hypothetical protein